MLYSRVIGSYIEWWRYIAQSRSHGILVLLLFWSLHCCPFSRASCILSVFKLVIPLVYTRAVNLFGLNVLIIFYIIYVCIPYVYKLVLSFWELGSYWKVFFISNKTLDEISRTQEKDDGYIPYTRWSWVRGE